tara:strand:+ start:1752 stop:2513 length:762 start_codon:yes stop_codon:yes gene_type:complete
MENTYNFDVNVILSDRLNPFPGNFDSEFLENNEEYKNLDKEYADDNNNLYDIYKDSSLSLYNNVNKSNISISGDYKNGIITDADNIDLNKEILLLNNNNFGNIIDKKYSMNSKEVIIKELDAYDLLKGLQEVSPISKLYFSNNNIKAINDIIKYEIYKKTNIVIDNPNKIELLIIMRSIYLQYSQNLNTNDVLAEVKYINKIVVNNVINKIEVEISSYENYIKDINKPNNILNRPINTSSDWRDYTFDFTTLI